jgi:dTDP-4-dehydrorhamnose reductase
LKILLTGKKGKVGYELERSLQSTGEVIAMDRTQMNLADLAQVRDVIRAVKPDLIVNPAAYTAVDKAEGEPELALCINGHAPAVMAEEAKKIGAAMIHYSTDYVFDGAKTVPYTEEDTPCPINAYGHSKLAGELAIQAAGIPHLILRTSWVYGMRGKNFLTTMIKLGQERTELRIVGDQYGAPTWCRTIADTTAHITAQSRAAKNAKDWWQERSGLYHLTALGETTWFEFAKTIFENSPLTSKPVVIPIATDEYPSPAKRPANSRLSTDRLTTTFCCLPSWRSALRLCQQ